MRINFRETKDLNCDCTSCENFTSYQAEYEDDLEPSEYGRCSKDFLDETVGEGMVCDLFKSKFINV